jgi:hypothetical protein
MPYLITVINTLGMGSPESKAIIAFLIPLQEMQKLLVQLRTPTP